MSSIDELVERINKIEKALVEISKDLDTYSRRLKILKDFIDVLSREPDNVYNLLERGQEKLDTLEDKIESMNSKDLEETMKLIMNLDERIIAVNKKVDEQPFITSI